MQAGIRELRDNLSRYIRKVEAGDRISITVNGRVVAELVPVAPQRRNALGHLDGLVEAGILRAPTESGPIEWPDIRLPKGTAAQLIDEDRGDA